MSEEETLFIQKYYMLSCRNTISRMWVKGQRSSSAMGLISKTLRSISVSSALLFHCFINDNICTRWSDIQLHNIKEPYSPFHFLLVGSLIACTLSLYIGLKLCIYKNIRNL